MIGAEGLAYRTGPPCVDANFVLGGVATSRGWGWLMVERGRLVRTRIKGKHVADTRTVSDLTRDLKTVSECFEGAEGGEEAG